MTKRKSLNLDWFFKSNSPSSVEINPDCFGLLYFPL